MASHKKMQSSSAPQATPEEIMKIYSGVGKTFRVKFVGSENIQEKGDAVALTCLKSLKNAQQQLGYHKPKAVLGLNTKGLTLFDERSKANTRVAISKVSHLTHDPNDICYFGVVVMTTESTSGLKLYAFKAERQVAMQFNQSSKELFDLMFRLKEAKKRVRERREQEAAAAAAATEAAANTPAPKVVGGVEAPPDYRDALTFDVHQEEENPPPVPPRKSITEPEPLIVQDDPAPAQQQLSTAPLNTDERRQRALDEWSKLEDELDDIAKDLNLDFSGGQASSELYSVPEKSRKLNSSGAFSDELLSLDLPSPTSWTNFDTTEAQTSSPFTSTPASGNPQESISIQLNPFAAQPQSPSTFNSGVSAEYTNPAYNTSTSLEPNISMDLENVLASPPQLQFPQQPPQPMASFGQPFGTQPMVSGMGQQMSYPQGPFQQQPVGMFQQPQQQAAPDLLSSPGSESFMAFSQPLQPASSIPAPPPGPPPKGDVFADLLDIAKKNAPELTPATPPPAPPPVKNEPKQYVSMNKLASVKDRPLPPVPGNDPFGIAVQPPPPAVTTSPSTGFNTAFGGVEEIYDDFDFSSLNKPQQQAATPAAAATGGGGGFGDSFAGAAAPSSNPPAPAQTGWIGFDDETKGQWL